MPSEPDPLQIGRLRRALVEADFTYAAVADLLGPEAHAALGRNETTPGRLRTADPSGVAAPAPLATLARLFLLQHAVATSAAERALPGLLPWLASEGLVEQSAGEVVARLDLRPYAVDSPTATPPTATPPTATPPTATPPTATPPTTTPPNTDLWVVSDLTPGMDGGPQRVGAEYVLGISPASISLAQLTLRHRVGSSLDLGTGCGVQALHLAAHSDRVVATDVNPRALRIARFNMALNAPDAGPQRVDVRAGSLFEPVAGERFDLIATNPPFVISPATGERLIYRDSGLPGDRVVEHILRGSVDHLTDGGWCQILANWVIPEGADWSDRLAGWVPPDLDAFVVQRETLDPAEYVELWLKDSGHHGAPDYPQRYAAWLAWLRDQRIGGVGFGWINLRRTSGTPIREFLDWPHAVEQPIGAGIGAWAEAHTRLAATTDDALLDAHLVRPEAVVQETHGEPGAADPESIVLRQTRGLARARLASSAEAALVGASDGDLSVGQIIAALAALTDEPAEALRADLLPRVRGLVAEGFVELPPR